MGLELGSQPRSGECFLSAASVMKNILTRTWVATVFLGIYGSMVVIDLGCC